MKKFFLSLVTLLLVCGLTLSLPAVAETVKPGGSISITVNYNATQPMSAGQISYTYSSGLTFVDGSSNPPFFSVGPIAAAGVFMVPYTGSGTVTINFKVKDDASGNQFVNISSIEGSGDGWSSSIGTPKKYDYTVEADEVWGEWTIDKQPTCTVEGERSRESDKGTKQTEKIPALKHNYQPGKILEEATCTKVGKQEFFCKNDPNHKEVRDIPMLAHKEGPWEIVKHPDPAKKLNGLRVKKCLVGGEILKEEVIPYVTTRFFYNNTASSLGLRFRDVKPELGKKWFMFSPVDLSADGEQSIPIVASNAYYLGNALVKVEGGNVTVTYTFPKGVKVKSEFLTFFADLASVANVDPAALADQAYTFGEPISIQEALGGDTKVLLYTNFVIDYNDSVLGIKKMFTGNREYKQAIQAMKALMED